MHSLPVFQGPRATPQTQRDFERGGDLIAYFANFLLITQRLKNPDNMLIIILVLLLIFGGGFGGYYGYNRYGPRDGIGIIGLVILIILLVWLFGGGGFHLHD